MTCHLLSMSRTGLWLVSDGTVKPYETDLERPTVKCADGEKARQQKFARPSRGPPRRKARQPRDVIRPKAEAGPPEAARTKIQRDARPKLPRSWLIPALYGEKTKVGELEVVANKGKLRRSDAVRLEAR